MHTLRLVPFALVLVGCGPSTFKEFCEQSVEAQCRQVFRCDEATAKTFYLDVADCQKSMKASANCGQFDSISCTIDKPKANTCINDIEQATCSSTFTLPASCQAQVCNATSEMGTDGGTKVSCSKETGGNSSMNGMSTCSSTLEKCTDNKVYNLQCTSGGGTSTCSCRVDGTEVKSYTPMAGESNCASNADERALMKTKCEFPLK